MNHLLSSSFFSPHSPAEQHRHLHGPIHTNSHLLNHKKNSPSDTKKNGNRKEEGETGLLIHEKHNNHSTATAAAMSSLSDHNTNNSMTMPVGTDAGLFLAGGALGAVAASLLAYYYNAPSKKSWMSQDQKNMILQQFATAKERLHEQSATLEHKIEEMRGLIDDALAMASSSSSSDAALPPPSSNDKRSSSSQPTAMRDRLYETLNTFRSNSRTQLHEQTEALEAKIQSMEKVVADAMKLVYGHNVAYNERDQLIQSQLDQITREVLVIIQRANDLLHLQGHRRHHPSQSEGEGEGGKEKEADSDASDTDGKREEDENKGREMMLSQLISELSSVNLKVQELQATVRHSPDAGVV